MAHFAQIDETNTVIQVIVVNNQECQIDGIDNEEMGIAFCKSLLGNDTIWKQTSYNANIRKNYAGIGYTYNSDLDAFIPPKPFNSWLLNEDTCLWYAPVAYPEDGQVYHWNEDIVSWILAEQSE